MKKIERLNGIIYKLKENKKITAKELSDYFEVSMRTIYRDIDALSQLKVPIISYEGLNGGYEIEDDYFIPSIKLTEKEIIVLLIVLKLGKSIKLPNLSSDYELVRSKIINILDEKTKKSVDYLLEKIGYSSSKLEPKEYYNNVLDIIFESLREDLDLEIEYYTPKRDEYMTRRYSPKDLYFDGGGWYLNGYCHLRKEKRVFRLDRIKKAVITKHKNQYINEIIVSSTEKFIEKEYTLDICESLYRIIKDDDYLRNVIVINESNPLRIKLTTVYEKSIIELVLGNPNEVTVIGPETFKSKLVKMVYDLYSKYEGDNNVN